MLRITERRDRRRGVTVNLEGALDADGAELVREACREPLERGLAVTLELSCLRFACGDGVRVLRALRASGARLLGASPLVARLVR